MTSPALKSLLSDLRQHPAFQELIHELAPPAIPRFKRSQAVEVESARAMWIYASGKRDQHDSMVAFLTGEQPSQQE